MVQTKKPEIKEAILRSATELFSAQGYNATKLTAIAARAGLAVGNLYSYFPSKLHLLYAIYRPWFEDWLMRLECDVRALPTAHQKLHRLIVGLWHDFPADNPGLANSLMEALSSHDAKPGKPDDLLAWAEERLTGLLRDSLPSAAQGSLAGNALSHILLMAQDGFIINHRWANAHDVAALATITTDMVLRELAVAPVANDLHRRGPGGPSVPRRAPGD